MGSRMTSPSTARRRLTWLVVAALAVALLAVWGVVDRRDTDTATTTEGSSSALPARSVAAGEVTVKIEPRRLDSGGATFKVTFDTHAVELDLDVADAARFVVDGTLWPVTGWSGDGPGGHHREGELRFRTAGPVGGTATLTLDGLPKRATASWELGRKTGPDN